MLTNIYSLLFDQLARRLFAADANDAVEKVVSKYLWALLNLVINKSITDGAKLDFMRYYYENGAPLDRTGGEGRFPSNLYWYRGGL